MVTDGGVVKILDFGLAKLVQSSAPPTGESQETAVRSGELTGAHTILGTPQYMSPEQIHRRREPFDLGDVPRSARGRLAFLRA